MRNAIHKLFLNDNFILFVILINSCIIYAQVAGMSNTFLNVLDVLCLSVFVIEMIVKHHEYGVQKYWEDGWNRLDGILVIISIPTLIEIFVPMDVANLSFFNHGGRTGAHIFLCTTDLRWHYRHILHQLRLR